MLLHRRFSYRRLCCARRGVKRTSQPFKCRLWDCWPRRGSLKLRAVVGASWTTDGPFRETEEAIEAARAKGILAVEMEAAALHTFARSARVRLLFQDFGF